MLLHIYINYIDTNFRPHGFSDTQCLKALVDRDIFCVSSCLLPLFQAIQPLAQPPGQVQQRPPKKDADSAADPRQEGGEVKEDALFQDGDL